MKKRKSGVHIYLTNRWLYTFIVIGILIVVGIGVYAATYTASGAGHPYTEISTCPSNGQILKMSGGVWTCSSGLECVRIQAPSFTTFSVVQCPSGYISTGGGAVCQSWLDRIGRSEPTDTISPSASGWVAQCFQGTTNNPSNTKATVICCK